MIQASFKTSFSLPLIPRDYQFLFDALTDMVAMSRDMTEGAITLSINGTLIPAPEKSDDPVQE